MKEGKDIPEDLQAKLASTQAKAEATPPTPTKPPPSGEEISTAQEIELLKSKVSVLLSAPGIIVLRIF